MPSVMYITDSGTTRDNGRRGYRGISALGHEPPRRAADGAAGPHSIADTEGPQNSARTSALNAGRLRLSIWWAEWPRSAWLASHVDLLGYGESVINLNAKITNRALNLGMAEQKLNRP